MATIYRGPKPFSFSYSKVKNYETCPKRYFHVDVKKDVKEEESDALIMGNLVHEALAKRLGPKKIALPAEYVTYEEECQRIEQGDGDILVEQKLAITKDFAACEFFAPNAWYRGVADVIKHNGRVAWAGDWKTGAIKEDSVQLALMAQCVFSKFPSVQAVKTSFLWLAHNAVTDEVFRRQDMPTFWGTFMSRVKELQHAHENTLFPAKPSGLCKRYCPVTQCPYHGEGR